MKKYILMVVLSLLFISKVDAATICSNKMLSELRNSAQNITYTYDYDTEKKSFTVTFNNVDKQLYLYVTNKNKKYEYTGEQMTLNYFAPGTNYKVNVYTSNIRCIDKNLYTIYINLPYYNVYYKDSLCEGYEEFEYCKKFLPFKLTRSELKKGIQEYKEQLIEQEEKEKNKKNILNILLNADKRIYAGVAIFIIALVFIIRYFYNKKHDLF